MNIMIPMAGRGSRFTAEGYRLPKPLINIAGRPMIFWLLDNLKFEPGDTLWIGIQQKLGGDYAMEARLRTEYPALDLRVISIDFQTRGAAETLFIMLQQMSPLEARRKSISLDCDTIYFSDVLACFRACPSGCGSTFYFEDEGDKPIFSYIDFERGTDTIIRIREKEAISRHASTGAYAFPCGDQLRNACRRVLENPVGKAGEFYTSSIIEGMIRAGQKFVGTHVPDFFCVGTPAQLRSFLGLIRAGAIRSQRKARIYFDLERSIGMSLAGSGAHNSVSRQPVERDVRLLRTLRIPGTQSDEAVLGEPVADAHIGGRSGIYMHEDMENEIGWCLQESAMEASVLGSAAQDFMTPRSFNSIACLDNNLVTKSAPLEYLRGEINWYRSIPRELAHLFPTLVGVNEDLDGAVSSMTITKVDGVNFSRLVTNHCVTRGRFQKLLDGLHAIHVAKAPSSRAHGGVGRRSLEEQNPHLFEKGRSCTGVLAAPVSEPPPLRIPTERSSHPYLPAETICANLQQKVLHRLEQNKEAYNGFEGIDVPGMSRNIMSFLHKYQEEARFRRADFVHGDPVFSNCLLNKESEVVFIDMRGALGDLVCTNGDVNYDLSKVYQSLCGYDFFILDKDINRKATDMLRDLEENVFWPFVRKNYAGTSPEDIAMLAAAHFLSIVPLHENREHQARFLKACKIILALAGNRRTNRDECPVNAIHGGGSTRSEEHQSC